MFSRLRSQSQRPGSVVQISEHPQDSNKLLIGYSSGLLVLWDLRAKDAEARFKFTEVRPLNYIIEKKRRPTIFDQCALKLFDQQ